MAVSDPAAQFVKIQAIISQRCTACHADKPTQAGFAAAPAGIELQTSALIRQNAAKVYQQVVQTRAMPLANLTQMTDAERAQVAAWYEAGAK